MSATTEAAKTTGFKDGLLTVIFGAGSLVLVTVLSWVLNASTGINLGKWEWLRIPLVMAITAIVKGLDRQVHEDPASPDTGLVQV